MEFPYFSQPSSEKKNGLVSQKSELRIVMKNKETRRKRGKIWKLEAEGERALTKACLRVHDRFQFIGREKTRTLEWNLLTSLL